MNWIIASAVFPAADRQPFGLGLLWGDKPMRPGLIEGLLIGCQHLRKAQHRPRIAENPLCRGSFLDFIAPLIRLAWKKDLTIEPKPLAQAEDQEKHQTTSTHALILA